MLVDTLAQAKTWDTKAFGALYDASYDRVYRYIFHRTLDTIQTEDIISEVYEKVMRSMTKFRGSTEWEYYSWIYHICYTTIIDYSRADIWVDSLEDISWEPYYDASDDIDARDKLVEVLEYMKTLSEKERTILTMRIWDDLSYAEISLITGESEANIRKIVSRTLAKIASNVSALSLIIFLLSHVY